MKKHVMTRHIYSILGLSALGASMAITPSFAYASSFTEALTGGTAKLDFRLRYEGVEQEGRDDASALTLRTRLGYLTGDYNGFSGFVEMSNNTAYERNDYLVPAGPDANTPSTKAVVLDPELTTLNQAWIAYQTEGLKLKYGHQRIIMDTRFLGNVGWRQQEQIYSGLSLNAALKGFKFDYAYINNVLNPVGVDIDMTSHAGKLEIAKIPFGKLTAYGYLLDYEVGTDSQTVGLRLAGKTGLSESIKLSYHLEYADQSDYKDSNNIGGDYHRAELGLTFNGIKILAGQERLGGDGSSAFQTPLGTVHLYNGWADMFIGPVGGTPANGLIDNYLKVSGKALGMKLAAAYHDFGSDIGSIDYGSEIDLLAAKKLGKNYTVGIKYASYSADSYAVDTDKLWVWGELKF
ncbi:hypothetical protein J3998_06085 [Thiomicrorhabdus sp. 6S2-11]|uniref:Alginate export domain-containing protein n=1 Tax=Thiomicrorhabdus marina TaxID=2818442 RepID=A0ABS3Q4C7_9GAMM|nr:hypothetical protein [Thiomicrorhabdus marina]MBO1927141.1 hypothetical protein [Thiomicrorhabdus marina]